MYPGYESVLFIKFTSFFMASVSYMKDKMSSSISFIVIKRLVAKHDELMLKENVQISDFESK